MSDSNPQTTEVPCCNRLDPDNGKIYTYRSTLTKSGSQILLAAMSLVVAVFIICPERSSAGSLQGLLQRNLRAGDVVIDSSNGNAHRRTDRFTNVSPSRLQVDDLDVIVFDPFDLGFDDAQGALGSPSIDDIFDAANAAVPGAVSVGLHWDGGELVPTYSWTSQSVGAPSLPFFLEPGESFELTTLALNGVSGSTVRADGIYPDRNDWDNNGELGEVVTVFAFSGRVVPEPSSIALFGIGALGMVGCTWPRRKKIA